MNITKDSLRQRTEEIIEKTPKNTMNQVASCKRKIRERAIQTLIQPLDIEKQEDNMVFQSLPLHLSHHGNTDMALSYIETLGTLGHCIDWEIVQKVYEKAVSELKFSDETVEKKFIDRINRKISLLLDMSEKHPVYSKNPDLYVLIGKDYERKGEPQKAFPYYDKSIEMGDEKGLFQSAFLHEKLGNDLFALSILEYGWENYHNPIFLEHMIRLNYKQEDRTQAQKNYQELLSLKGGVSEANMRKFPFILYSGNIENDKDLQVFEELMAHFFEENTMIAPLEGLHRLSLVAKQYIEINMANISKRCAVLSAKMKQKVTSENYQEYCYLVLKRLYFAQVHILCLKYDTFIPGYMKDMELLAFFSDTKTKEFLRGYFEKHFSPQITHFLNSYKNKTLQKKQDESKIKKETEEDEEDISFMLSSDIMNHVAMVSKSFFHFSYFELQKQIVFPIFLTCFKENQDLDGGEENIGEKTSMLQSEHDYFNSYPIIVRQMYANFINNIDKKYGLFYRRFIQNFVRENPDADESSYSNVLQNFPDIALLFFIEKILTDTMYIEDSEKFGQIVQKYHLFYLGMDEKMLFCSFFFGISEMDTIHFLMLSPKLFHNTYGIFLILEGLKQFDEPSRKMMIKELHFICQQEYQSRGFFAHIHKVLNDKMNQEISDDEKEFIFLCNGNMAILQKKGVELPLLNFKQAEKYGSVESLLHMGDIFQDIGDFETAIDYFEQAYLKEDSLANFTKIFSCLMSAGNFDKAQRYISLGFDKGFEMSQFIFAHLLLQGKYLPAFEQFISMNGSGKEIYNFPEGILTLLYDTCEFITTKNKNEIDMKFKIFASYIQIVLRDRSQKITHQPILNHICMIENLFAQFQGEEFYHIINETIGLILKDKLVLLGTDNQNLALHNIHFHFSFLYYQFLEELKDTEENTEKQKKENILIINSFLEKMILILRTFPKGEKLCGAWKQKIKFFPYNNTSMTLNEEYGSEKIH